MRHFDSLWRVYRAWLRWRVIPEQIFYADGLYRRVAPCARACGYDKIGWDCVSMAGKYRKFIKMLGLIDILRVFKRYMATAYVLINCELGSEEVIIEQLKSLDGVREVHGTFGAYDILAKIESDTVEKLRETITWKIRKIEKIRSTLTLMGIEGQT